MKKIALLLIGGLLGALMFSAVTAFADSTDPYPSWMPLVIGQAEALPSVGTTVKGVVTYLGVIAGCLTALAACMDACFGFLGGVLKSAGFANAAAKVQAFEAKIMPWVKYWSMYNVQAQPASPPSSAQPASSSSAPPASS